MDSQLLKLVLASQSPRRKELLNWLQIPFEIIPSHVEEISDKRNPAEVAEDLAKLKGRNILENTLGGTSSLIVASDTLVCLGGKVYGKPGNENEAREYLMELSGKTHEVISSIYLGLKLIDQKKESLISETWQHCRTLVTFAPIDREVLDNYIQTKDSLDKAGAYGIQGASLTFIEKIEGSYSNVVGLPLYELRKLMKSFLEQKLGHKNKLEEYFVES